MRLILMVVVVVMMVMNSPKSCFGLFSGFTLWPYEESSLVSLSQTGQVASRINKSAKQSSKR